jgi:hypothetical protein
MTASPDDALDEIRRTLATWHATHPDATFLEREEAVEAQLHRLRARLLAEQTEQTFAPEHPTCRECGAQMEPRTQRDRHLVLGGDEAVDLHRP